MGNGPDGPPHLTLAVHSSDFPLIPALDWSYPSLVGVVERKIMGMPDGASCVPIVVRAMAENQSIAFYDGVLPNRLRWLSPGADPTKPHEWPVLCSRP